MIFFVFFIKDFKKVEGDLYVEVNVLVIDEEWLYKNIEDFDDEM